MRAKLFDERGEWTPAGLEATQMVNPIIERLFDEVFKAYGFNPREIGQMLTSEIEMTTLCRMLLQDDERQPPRRPSPPPLVIYLPGPVPCITR